MLCLYITVTATDQVENITHGPTDCHQPEGQQQTIHSTYGMWLEQLQQLQTLQKLNLSTSNQTVVKIEAFSQTLDYSGLQGFKKKSLPFVKSSLYSLVFLHIEEKNYRENSGILTGSFICLPWPSQQQIKMLFAGKVSFPEQFSTGSLIYNLAVLG